MNYDGVAICGNRADMRIGQSACHWGALGEAAAITWSVVDAAFPGLPLGDVKEAFVLAWRAWELAAGIVATYQANDRTANVVVDFGRIDGPNRTLAHMQLPCGNVSQVHGRFDLGEAFVISENPPSDKIDLVRVARHEFGHAIGIEHIGSGNLMAPTYSSKIRELQEGDISHAFRRYGRPQLRPTPDQDAGLVAAIDRNTDALNRIAGKLP